MTLGKDKLRELNAQRTPFKNFLSDFSTLVKQNQADKTTITQNLDQLSQGIDDLFNQYISLY